MAAKYMHALVLNEVELPAGEAPARAAEDWMGTSGVVEADGGVEWDTPKENGHALGAENLGNDKL